MSDYIQAMINKNILPLKSIILAICLLILPGCSPLKYLVAKEMHLTVPQAVAYLQPSVRGNEILVSGKVVMQNLEKSDLTLDRVFIEIKDENDILLDKLVFDWEDNGPGVKKEKEALLDIRLPLTVLSHRQIVIFLNTKVSYAMLHIDFPVKSKLAVLDLEMLKKTIIRPFDVSVYTKIYSNISGNISADFTFDIANPTEVQLMLRGGVVRIYTREKGDIATMRLPEVTFLPGQNTRIKDKMKLDNVFEMIAARKLFSAYPLRLKISGEMVIPGTDIFMPFSVESSQEIDFSLLPKKNKKW